MPKTSQSKAALEALGGQLASLTKSYGYVLAFFFPDVDSALATSILIEALARNNVEVIAVPSVTPPIEPRDPVVYLGYPVEVLDKLKPQKGGVLFARGEQPQGLTRLPTVASRDTSIAGLVASALSEVTVIGELGLYAIIAGYWRGLDLGKRAEFKGLETQLLETLSMENKVVGSLTIRLFRWFEKPVEESIEITLSPFMPGFSCARDNVVSFLKSDSRLSKAIGKRVSDLDQDLLALLAEKLYDELKKASRVARRPSELIGYTYYTEVLPLKDLREAAYILYTLAELRGISHLVPIASSPSQVSAAAYVAYEGSRESICEAINELHSNKPKEERVGRLIVARTDKVDEKTPLAIVEKQLRVLGDIGSETVLAAERNGELHVSLETVIELQGYQWIIEAIGKGCLEPIDDSLLAVLNTAKCSW